jgi:hypothetical protein
VSHQRTQKESNKFKILTVGGTFFVCQVHVFTAAHLQLRAHDHKACNQWRTTSILAGELSDENRRKMRSERDLQCKPFKKHASMSRPELTVAVAHHHDSLFPGCSCSKAPTWADQVSASLFKNVCPGVRTSPDFQPTHT